MIMLSPLLVQVTGVTRQSYGSNFDVCVEGQINNLILSLLIFTKHPSM